MKKEHKDAWLQALRSGDYKQGKGFLKRNLNGEDTWCCLGVLADTCGDKSLWDRLIWDNQAINDDPQFANIYTYEGSPYKYGSQLGLSMVDTANLAGMNDGIYQLDGSLSHSKNFLEIADWIEENIKEEA